MKQKTKNKNTNNPLRLAMAAICLTLVVLAAGCVDKKQPGGDNGGDSIIGTYDFLGPDQKIATNNFKSEKEFKDFIKNHEGSYGYGGFLRGGVFMEALSSKSSSDSANTITGSNAPSQGQNDYSGTNNQVTGVDEADILKTDGNYIYTVTGKTLFIVKAYPGEDAEVVSVLEFENYPRGLFIYGDKLAVIGDLYNYEIVRSYSLLGSNSMTYLNIYDISDKSEPELEKEYAFEGYYFNARLMEDNIYLVTNSNMDYRVDLPTPLIIEDGEERAIPVEKIHYFNIPYNYPNLANIHTISMTSLKNTDSESVMVEGALNMYMSEENMFLVYTDYIDEWEIRQKKTVEIVEDMLSDMDKTLIKKIRDADPEVLTKYEKESKVLQIVMLYINNQKSDRQEEINDEIEKEMKKELDKYKYAEYTIINRVEVKSTGISIEANGKVPGHVLNQFSMDEYKDVFRIATTVSPRWSNIWMAEKIVEDETIGVEKIAPVPLRPTQSTNNVYTLDKELNVLDSLEGLAEGEQIFSARFMGEKLYMVTFRQVDPFFVIDLKDPEKIQELGQLKIPGFSRYLHPYDEKTIIGIGRDASELGRQEGLKISLFDVSDVKNPKEIAKYVAKSDYTQTTAEWEHKAFLFSKEKNLLVLPVYSYDYETPSKNINGAFVFKISEDEITLRGLIDHSKSTSNWYSPNVERSLYINELLYTKSPNLLRINELSDLSSVKNVDLDPAFKGNIPVY